jgi:hypothetical protein
MMVDRAELARLPQQSADPRGARSPQPPARDGRCLGAAAQLVAVHRALRHGPALQLRPRTADAARPRVSGKTAAPPLHRNGADAGVVQRMVLNLDSADKAISDAAQIAVAREKAATKKQPASITEKHAGQALLRFLGESEELVVLAHGTPAMGGDVPRVAGKTAEEMVDYLIQMGLDRTHTGIINLSNCTSAWDRKNTGSFADKFLAALLARNHRNIVKGFESFTESVDVSTELQVKSEDREKFLAHKFTERYMMSLMNLRENDSSELIKSAHDALSKGAKMAFIEPADFSQQQDNESKALASYYGKLANLIVAYLVDAQDKYQVKVVDKFQTAAMDHMKAFGLDNLGAKIGKEPSLHVTKIAIG